MKLLSRIFTVPFWSTALGNFFEHYDSALFGFLSPFLAPIFFPKQDPLTALILTYCMIPLGMLAKPFGSLLFGYIGDRYSRKEALFLSLAGMGLISLLIALTPPYAAIGILAPVLFCFWRLCQSFLAAGETMGGAIFILESVDENHQDMISSFYEVSTIGGILIASVAVSFLSFLGNVNEYWRALYLFGSITALFGLIIRKKLPSTSSQDHFVGSYSKLIRENLKPLFIVILVSGLYHANATIALVLLNGFLPLISSLSKAQMSGLNTSLLLFDFLALPFFGWVATKISREKLMMWVSLCIAITALPLFGALQGASFFKASFIRMIFVIYGIAFTSPFHAWVQQIVPESGRYSVISLGYAIGSQLFGGTSAAISLWLYKSTSNASLAGLYWTLLSLTTFIILRRTQKPECLATYK